MTTATVLHVSQVLPIPYVEEECSTVLQYNHCGLDICGGIQGTYDAHSTGKPVKLFTHYILFYCLFWQQFKFQCLKSDPTSI